jgi:hypothetical protein
MESLPAPGQLRYRLHEKRYNQFKIKLTLAFC